MILNWDISSGYKLATLPPKYVVCFLWGEFNFEETYLLGPCLKNNVNKVLSYVSNIWNSQKQFIQSFMNIMYGTNNHEFGGREKKE